VAARRSEPGTRGEQVERVEERRAQGRRLRGGGVARPCAGGHSQCCAQPRLASECHTVGGGPLALVQEQEPGQQQEQAVADQPHGAELAPREQPDPLDRLQPGAGAAGHHRRLVSEHRKAREQQQTDEPARPPQHARLPAEHGRAIARARQ
jgi:hypothetical protein